MEHEEIQTRRSEELNALQAFYGNELQPCLPCRRKCNEDDLSIQGPWFIQLTSFSNSSPHDVLPTLEIRLPPKYPFGEPPTPVLHNVNYYLSPSKKESLLVELKDMYEPEMDVGILWAERCREEFVDMANYTTPIGKVVEPNLDEFHDMSIHKSPATELNIKLLYYNHLLFGKSHKKEAQLVTAASKMGFVGFITYGNPGIVGILISRNGSCGITTNERDVVDFSKECSNIGKKCDVLDVTFEINDDGFIWGPSLQNDSNEKKLKTRTNGLQNKYGSDRLHSLLVDMIGEDKVAGTKRDKNPITITKKGLKLFSSCADLKKMLVDCHGMNEKKFQEIIRVNW
eukprot:scaffold436_cov55-Cyclotella_meneghiniana.AAC.4